MGKIHYVKIEPGYDAETNFIQLLGEVNVKPENLMCRLGSVFETPYNEYIISDGLYKQISEVIKSKKDSA